MAGDLCDCCGSGNIWYIDVTDSDITSTHDHTASGLYWSTSRA
jgi:hypothetical protein